ncbi:hypothetical protein [Enterococcus casseliflavus]|uniref:hypothetical protein n=1 Tax=Enterococcus casseliflavus TaxID=37734 RepID=UPI0035DFB6EE
MEKLRLRYICESCGKIGLYHNEEEGFKDGWDYPPRMGNYRILSPRTCGQCSIDTTLYWAIITGEIHSFNEMTFKQKATLARILGEPDTIFINGK